MTAELYGADGANDDGGGGGTGGSDTNNNNNTRTNESGGGNESSARPRVRRCLRIVMEDHPSQRLL